MKADSYRILEVFSNGGSIHYVLPHFQREYRWDQGDWQTLLDDVMATYDAMPQVAGAEAPDPEHFLGSLVVVEDGTQKMVPIFKLVDGQQRLISLSLLLCALARVASASHPDLLDSVRHYLFNNQKNNLRFKILPTTKNGDREAYCAVLEGKPAPPCRSLVRPAFDFFTTKLREEISGGRDPEMLFEVLLSAFQVVFITIQSNENPYRIFESLNAKGKPLGQADLVRNYIAMRLRSDDQERIFNAHWAPIEESLSDQRGVGRLGELTAFLRHYDALQVRNLGSEKHIYARFRDGMKVKDDEHFVAELARLQRFASFYATFLHPDTLQDETLRAALKRLLDLDVSTVYPFLLAVADAHNAGRLSTVQWAEVCGVLENYLIRRLLLGRSISDLNKMFARLASDLDFADLVPSLKAALSRQRYPSDEHLRSFLPVTKMYAASAARKRAVLVLGRVNLHLSHGSDAYTVLAGAATIEHILPQNPSAAWKHELGEETDSTNNEWGDTPGNLTLVTGEHNSVLSNAPFAIKKEKLAVHGLKLNSAYFGARDIAVWDGEAIHDRGKWLTEQIIQIWPSLAPERSGRAPANPNSIKEIPILLQIDEHQWPLAAWRDLLRAVGEFLLAQGTDFDALSVKNPTVLSRQPFLKGHHALSNGWHLNLHYNAKDVMRHSKKLLQTAGVSSDRWQLTTKPESTT
jgi:uncharacterized protein with ParB-like and HNH nuclease domain